MRVNFETDVYTHEQYPKLLIRIGCEYKTDGLLLSAFKLAQKYWLEHRGIPVDKWPQELQVLVEFKFARTETRVNGCFIYVLGSEERCKFLDSKSKAGQKGGKSKSPEKLKHLRQNTEAPNQDRNTTETPDNETEAKGNHTETSSSISSSISNSSSRNSGEPAAGKFDLAGGDVGPIPVFSTSPLLSSILKNVSKAYQRSWIEYWPGKENKIRRSLEKAYVFYSGPSNGTVKPHINWEFVLTKWLWNERDLKEQNAKPGQVIEDHFRAFEAVLKAHNVHRVTDLLGELKAGNQ